MSKSITRAWWPLIRERFDPLPHALSILLFFAAHGVMSLVSGCTLRFLVPLLVGTAFFFFKLRLYDEIKDYDTDLIVNPDRPLARGAITHQQLYRGIMLCIGVELVTFGFAGPGGLTAMALAVLYSLFMYKEFFIPALIRPLLTTYAVTHTVVSVFLSLSLFSAMCQVFPWRLAPEQYLFALNSWCLFNIFEFGRKSFAAEEERPNVDSYSKIFGRWGAVLLVLGNALAVYLLLGRRAWIGATAVLLLVPGLIYAFVNTKRSAGLYRAMSSIYILLVYFVFIVLELPLLWHTRNSWIF